MKFHFEIINCKDSGSVYNVHIFAMFEGADCRESERFFYVGIRLRYF